MNIDLAHYHLLRLYLVQWRQGWEDGPTEEEVREEVSNYLANVDLDPTNNKDAVYALIKQWPCAL